MFKVLGPESGAPDGPPPGALGVRAGPWCNPPSDLYLSTVSGKDLSQGAFPLFPYQGRKVTHNMYTKLLGYQFFYGTGGKPACGIWRHLKGALIVHLFGFYLGIWRNING